MTIALLAVLALAQDAGEREVRALVEQLNSDDLAQRDGAREELLRRGRPIRRHLEAFLSSDRPELVAQVRAILDRFDWEEQIERSLPPERLVTIPAGKRTPEEIFRIVREQTGLRVSAAALNLRATIEAGWDRAPVLQVLDDVCRRLGRGALTAPALEARGDTGWRRGRERPLDHFVIDGDQPLDPAVAHHGRFRAAVTDVSVTEQRSLAGGASTAQAFVTLSVSTLPGVQPIYVGAWTVEEAVDDRGGSLLVTDEGARHYRESPPPEPGDDADAAWFGTDRWSSYRDDGFAIRPPSAGATTFRLRAKLRVAFPAREVVRTLTVAEFKEREEIVFGRAKIVVTKAANAERKFSMQYAVSGSSTGSPRFELLDAQGAPIQLGGSSARGDGTKTDQTWTLPAGAAVASVRVTAWVGHRAFDIPFEWSDVPLPAEDR